MAAPRLPAPPPWATSITSVGVTGTNGKTTTTAWIAAALRSLSSPVARATTVGFFLDETRVDIPLTYQGFLAGMRQCHEAGGRHAALELTSESLAQGYAKIWPCKVGVFTNLTHDHLDAHGTPEHYLASKAQLFMALGPGCTAVLNASDPNYDLLREVTAPGTRHLSYAVPSRGAPAGEPDIVATSVSVDWRGTRITCAVKDAALPTAVSVRGIGDVYAENALAALLGAVAAGADPGDAAKAIADAPAPPGRFEVIHERPYVVVDYAHSPDALARTVAIARRLAAQARLLVVFGAGGKRDRDKRGPMGTAARAADTVILTSDNPRDEDPRAIAQAIAAGLTGHGDVRTELDRKKAIELAIREAKENDVVLVAGKGHETEQTVGTAKRHFSDVEVALAAL